MAGLLAAVGASAGGSALAASSPASLRVATTPAQGIAQLNALRAANGFPAAIAELPDWSSKCGLANNYNALNKLLTHNEEPSKPGYTEGGAYAAANSVLSSSSTPWRDANPWLHAPIHLGQMLMPRLTQMGASELETAVDWGSGPSPFYYACATTWPGVSNAASAPDAVTYTYPGNGRVGVDFSETARESPFTPGDLLGLPQPATTGPQLYVFNDRPGVSNWNTGLAISAAGLVGPDGTAVPVKWVDASSDRIGIYLQGGIIVPVSPLAKSTTYRATVTYSTRSYDGAQAKAVFNSAPVTYSWSFTTGDTAPPAPAPQVFSATRRSFSVRIGAHARKRFTRACGGALVALEAAAVLPASGRVLDSTPASQGAWQTVLLNPSGHSARARLTLVCLSLTGQGHRLLLGPILRGNAAHPPRCGRGRVAVQVGFGPGRSAALSCLADRTTINSGHYHRLILGQVRRRVELVGGSRAVGLRCRPGTTPVVGDLGAHTRGVRLASSTIGIGGWRFRLAGHGRAQVRLLCLSPHSTGEIYLTGSAGAGDASPGPPKPGP